MNVDHFFFLEYEDTILPSEDEADVRTGRAGSPGGGASSKWRRGRALESSDSEEVSESSHSSLADTLFQDFGNLPGKKDADLDEFAVINVGPSVVPNPFVPTFRIFAFNTTGDAYSQTLQDLELERDESESESEGGGKDGDGEVGEMKRDHSHNHPDRKKEKAECKKKAKKTWACRPRKPVHASGKSPIRTNRLWTPLGFAQYWLPGLEDAAKGAPPHFELEYMTFDRKEVVPGDGEGEPLIPLKELPKALRNAVSEAGAEVTGKAKKWKKYVPYGLEDLTIKRWMKLGRQLGREREEEVRAVFRRFMYQGADT